MTTHAASDHTFLFADLAGFTALTETHGDELAADLAEAFCDHARQLLPEHDAEEVKTIGDPSQDWCRVVAHHTHRSRFSLQIARMHPPQVRATVLELVDRGLNDCEISRRTGIARGTVRDMRRYGDGPHRRNGSLRRLTETCPRCWRWAKPMRFTPDDYAELLGLYLGDGSISPSPRTSRLRIVLDAKYPGIINDTRDLLERCFPSNDVHVGKGSTGNCRSVSVYSSHLICLFPQHGPGRKHLRRIVLEPWQAHLVQAAPWAFLRGCIRSDGCAFINRTGPYEYLSYSFSNHSEDITNLFVEVCGGLTLRPRVNRTADGRFHVRINRRENVALLLQHVGLKA